MMRQVGTALRLSKEPSGVRVRRHSYRAGECEGVFWRRTDRREACQVVLAARRYDLAGRQAGQRNGPLGHVGLEVIELLGNLVSYRSGRLEPAILYLMRKLKRSRAAVVRALAALRAHGFLDWLRRYEPVEIIEGPGPRVQQVSNAYRLSLPRRAAQLLGHLLSHPPLPDDVAAQQEERAATLAGHKAGLPLSELPLVEVENDRLAQVLGEMGRAVEARARLGKERESAKQTETQTKDLRSK